MRLSVPPTRGHENARPSTDPWRYCRSQSTTLNMRALSQSERAPSQRAGWGKIYAGNAGLEAKL